MFDKYDIILEMQKENEESIINYLLENENHKQVKELIIDNCDITNIDFIKEFSQLEKITLKNNKKLKNIRAVLLLNKFLIILDQDNNELDQYHTNYIKKQILGKSEYANIYLYLESFITNITNYNEDEDEEYMIFDADHFLLNFPTLEKFQSFLPLITSNDTQTFIKYMIKNFEDYILPYKMYEINSIVDKIQVKIEAENHFISDLEEDAGNLLKELVNLNKCYNFFKKLIKKF